MKTRLSPLTPVCALGFAFCFPIALQADTPPQIIDPPLAQFAWLGRPVTFKVSFTNNTAMTYQWQWNGARLPDATNNRPNRRRCPSRREKDPPAHTPTVTSTL